MWEPYGQRIEELGHYDVAIVLGGMADYNTELER